MEEIFNYLNEVSYMDPKLIKMRVGIIFNLKPEVVEKVYKAWKKEFMKVSYKEMIRYDKSRVRSSSIKGC